jgi:hypothetical protein
MVSKFKKLYSVFAVMLLMMTMRLDAQDWNGLKFIGNETGKISFNSNEMKDIFKAKYTFWQNKLPVTICLPQSQSLDAKEIYEKIYGKSVDEVKKFWLAQVFQGRSRSPHFFNTTDEMISFIAKTPGAVGVVKANIPIQTKPSLTLEVN